MEDISPLLIVGTGAMACLFAARLSAVHVPVILLGSWPEALAAIREHGVRVMEATGQEQAYRVQVATEPGECARVRYALVLVKSWQTERAARLLARCLAGDGLALTLQNGLGNQETLAAALGEERVALGVTTAGANLLAPGVVRPAGDGATTLGEHPRLEPLAELLRRAGFHPTVAASLDALLWGKLVINAAINPLTALLGVLNGELLERPTARDLMAAAACEAAAVAAACRKSLTYDDPVAAVEAVARRTAANRSSMLQDVQRGAPTEIDAICGAIVRAGEAAGVQTPINKTLWQLVKARDRG
jgi:2-dehydropantoate 2-reductase